MCEEATLLYVTNGLDADGFPTETAEELDVYVREKAATRTEFYAALNANVIISTVFEVRQEDFDRTKHITANGKAAYATKIRYDGAVYDILRTYRHDKSMIDLICA